MCQYLYTTAAYPPGLFQSEVFFFGSAHAFSPSRLERTTGKSERLTDGASTRYERLRKVPPLLEDFLSPFKSPCKRRVPLKLAGSARHPFRRLSPPTEGGVRLSPGHSHFLAVETRPVPSGGNAPFCLSATAPNCHIHADTIAFALRPPLYSNRLL